MMDRVFHMKTPRVKGVEQMVKSSVDGSVGLVTVKTPKSLRWRVEEGGPILICYHCRQRKKSGKFEDRETFFSRKEPWCKDCMGGYTKLFEKRKRKAIERGKKVPRTREEAQLYGELYRDRQRLYHGDYYRRVRAVEGWKGEGSRKLTWHVRQLFDSVFTDWRLETWIGSGMRGVACRIVKQLRECAAWKEFEDKMLAGVKGGWRVERVLPEDLYPEFCLASGNVLVLDKKGNATKGGNQFMEREWAEKAWKESAPRLQACFAEIMGVEGGEFGGKN